MNKKLLVILTSALLVILISSFVFLNKIKNDETKNIGSSQSPKNQEDIGYNKPNEYNKKDKIDISVGSNTSLCENACSNYYVKCMTFNPDLKPELMAQYINECIKECTMWDDKKKNCILEAVDCESMTDVCGL
ncbi:MAG TPA: hypothetical protein PKZ94_02745 [Candidatus Pacearchaeota archaeon]|jgi:hypothetical protein|nr:hypothetical protein [Candidatus Pacearchaeota archaeon]HPC37584.1 hypothetical protein [Candidatus Paceibacterota bacterium]HQG09522.1 hypothetical protein [Candidatus Pacearchaeota archaeon]HQK58354.1 hypothetical protein [Candidatus Pacearchaeota archaeon]HRU21010.1 hypothetical protein [Candidatus Paceibacterota bacterium]